MSFFGDQGWFYLSARDMLLTGNFPLVGIASSHPWLHQGAWWTYVLAFIFSLTHFNPLAPGYFSAGLGVVTVGLVYFFVSRMFASKVGLLAAFLYATSPLIIINMRMPYHTVFIPILALLYLFALSKWLGCMMKYFPVLIFSVAMLYNFEIATTPFTFILILCLVFGLWKRKKYATTLANKKIIGYSFLAWLIPMIPMLLYDVNHGFPQTIKFVLWLGYRFAKLFGFPDIHGDTVFEPLAPFLPFTATKLQDFLFLPNQWIAIVLFVAIFLALTYFVYQDFRKKEISAPLIALYVTFTIPFLSYMALQTSSEAYWPMFFPTTMIGFAYVAFRLFNKRKLFILVNLIVVIIGCFNTYYLVRDNYLMTPGNYGYPFNQRTSATQQIITEANGRKYTLIGKGEGSKFASFTMPYEYLTWWLGHGPSQKKEKLKIFVSETNKGIIVTENK
ncbi:MAG: ArnT family glycosyltransferase [Candidatus Levyibacteriota bacterium]